MEKITSFTIDHIKLQPGVYVSRKDPVGDQVITTFDIRMTSPNEEPVMNTAELHAMEHLAASCETIRSLARRSFTGVLWAAVPEIIFFLTGIMNPEISFR